MEKVQKSTDLIIPKTAFQRLLREILTEHLGPTCRIQASAAEAIQEATENFVISVLGGT